MSELYLSASTDAIDAAMITKARAVDAYLHAMGIATQRVGAIGDSVNDLPFLMLPDLALCGAPANAQAEVLRRVRAARNGMVMQERVTEAFLRFYQAARELGLSHVFSDRDGVLIWKDESDANRLALTTLFQGMGIESKPFVIILTGSSYDQNVSFMKSHGLDATLRSNPAVSANPYALWVENGALQVNVLDHSVRTVFDDLQGDVLATLKGPFERGVLEVLDREVLPQFGLGWSGASADQHSRVFVPPKRTMFTVNVPKTHVNNSDFRESAAGDAFREAVLGTMKKIADGLSLQYVVLGMADM